jgi:hypothetical protein
MYSTYTTIIGPGRMGGGGEAKDKRRDGEKVRGKSSKDGRKKGEGKRKMGREI